MRRRWTAGVGAALLAAAVAGSSATAAPAPAWAWPVADHRVVRGFEAPASVWAAGHRGIDVAAPPGEPVVAPTDGIVSFAGTVVDRGVVTVEAGAVRATLEPVVPSVRAGDHVARGEQVGVVGSGGSHREGVLHLGARVLGADGWGYVDPRRFLGGLQRAVLLPLSAFP